MTGLIWTALGVAALVGVIALTAARVHARTKQARETERVSRPEALRGAKLVYVEKLFRIRNPINLVAKLDRGYRNPDGQIVLVELKTRWSHKTYFTDVIQLSAQQLAVFVHSGNPVAIHGYVLVRSPGKRFKQTVHRVKLLPPDALTALAHRRAEILAGRTPARYAESTKACRNCAYRQACDRPQHEEAAC